MGYYQTFKGKILISNKNWVRFLEENPEAKKHLKGDYQGDISKVLNGIYIDIYGQIYDFPQDFLLPISKYVDADSVNTVWWFGERDEKTVFIIESYKTKEVHVDELLKSYLKPKREKRKMKALGDLLEEMKDNPEGTKHEKMVWTRVCDKLLKLIKKMDNNGNGKEE
jgi:hypothetical protein